MTITSTTRLHDFEPALQHAREGRQETQPRQEVKEAEPTTVKTDPEKLKAVLAESNISLNFRRDEGTGRIVVEMIDDTTGDAVRQIPNEVSLRLTEMFSKVQGRLFEIRA